MVIIVVFTCCELMQEHRCDVCQAEEDYACSSRGGKLGKSTAVVNPDDWDRQGDFEKKYDNSDYEVVFVVH